MELEEDLIDPKLMNRKEVMLSIFRSNIYYN